MRCLFGCPDIVSLTEKFLMARNFFQIFTENNPVMGSIKTFFIPEAKGLNVPFSGIIIIIIIIIIINIKEVSPVILPSISSKCFLHVGKRMV